MVIAVNTRFLRKGALEGYGYFIQEVFTRLAALHPEHRFYFIFDRPYDPSFMFSPNVIPLVIGPPARHPLLWKFWYDLRLPRLLKKIKADVFVSPDGYCSLATKVPQCLVVHDLGFLHYPKGYQKSHLLYLKRYVPRFLKRAQSVATVSIFSKKDIMERYGIPEEKISVVYSAAKEVFQPISFMEREVVKEKHSGGAEYFIYVGAIQPRKNLENLLRAFSFFKKRQQSGMKLVLAGRLAWKNEDFLKLLRTFRFRDDVILTGYLEEKDLARLLAGAYALVYPSFFEGFGVPVVEAMKCHVPVLTSEGTSMQEIAGEAALYFNPREVNEMAEAMMRIYKDERLRSGLILKGKETVLQYSWDRTAALVGSAIERAVNQKKLPSPLNFQ
jgi:glycosyltransferase involved in cell wall biosynthesis